MARLRFRRSTSLAVVLAIALTQTGTAQPQSFTLSKADYTPAPATDSADRSYKIYALDDLGGDPGFGEWIAQTIPEVIAQGTWKGPGVIRYYAPKNILVVCHTPAVQAKVEVFLKDMKQSLPGEKKTTVTTRKGTASDHMVIPAGYRAPALLRASSPTPEPSLSYPVPAQVRPPKHLFHFIIRYEGEGIIDDNVVKAMKGYIQAEKKASEAAAAGSSYSAPAPPANQPSATPPASTTSSTSTGSSTPATKDKEEKAEDKKDKEKPKEKTDEP
jgi:hypothetical protein